MDQELVTSNSQRALSVGKGGTYTGEMLRDERFRDGPGIKCTLDIIISGRMTVVTMGSETGLAQVEVVCVLKAVAGAPYAYSV